MKKFSIIIIIAILITLVSCTDNTEDITYATLNDEPITIEEIEYFKNKERANVINYYAAEFNISDFTDFWNTKYRDSTPSETLESEAFERAKHAKALLIVMREYGIYDDISYASLKEKAEKYNNEFKNDKNHVGLNTISMDSFYTYYTDNGLLELINVYYENEYVRNDAEVSEYKEKNNINDELSDIAIDKNICRQKIEDMAEKMINESVITVNKTALQ